MNDVFVYLVSMPTTIREMVTPCDDGDYTVYINTKISRYMQLEAYKHALKHITNHDFEKSDVQEIECTAHKSA